MMSIDTQNIIKTIDILSNLFSSSVKSWDFEIFECFAPIKSTLSFSNALRFKKKSLKMSSSITSYETKYMLIR